MSEQSVIIPEELGGSGLEYTSGTGERGMAGSNGYGYATLFYALLAEVIAMCGLTKDNAEDVAAAVGTALLRANNLSDLIDASAARTNLGLGSAAQLTTAQVLQPANNLSEVLSAATARTNLGLGSAAQLTTAQVLQPSNNLSEVLSAATARANLGLGPLATQGHAVAWSGLPASPAAGDLRYVTDVGSGSYYQYSASLARWRALNGQAVLATIVPTSGIGVTAVLVAQVLMPAGSLQAGDTIRLWIPPTKSGNTDNVALTVRLGTAGTDADTAVNGLSAMSVVGATSRASGFIAEIRVNSTTSVQRLGVNTPATSPYGGPSTSNTPAVATTVSDLSAAAVYVSVYIASGGATDTVNVNGGSITHVTP